MKKELKLSLDSFNAVNPLCGKAVPGLNAHKENCHHCVHAAGSEDHIFCSHFRRPVTSGQKYSLKEWKPARGILCSTVAGISASSVSGKTSYISHVSTDTTSDDPSDLVIHHNFRPARAHVELNRAGGAGRVLKVIDHYRLQRVGYTWGTLCR